jgi:site-specific recombinase XerD
MGALRNHMIDCMKVRGYSVKTIELYTSCVRVFATHYRQSPLDIDAAKTEAFFLYLREQGKSESTVHIYFESLKFFYRLHGIANRLPGISFSRLNRKVPEVLSQEEVRALLASCASLKFRTIFTVIYSAGLRISEAANLRLADIDFDRKTIYVRDGKNGKDRYTILANETITLLREYLGIYRPATFVFYGPDIAKAISTDAIERQFRNLLGASGIRKPAHVHTLRHCFATHLVENGTSIFYVMKLLGHSNIQTTMVYLHMRRLDLLNLESPIDSPRFRSIPVAPPMQPELFLASA